MVAKKHSSTLADARVILGEICGCVGKDENYDPVQLLEQIRMMDKVMQAVPRMESFI